MSFEALMQRFAVAVETADGDALADCFTPDGTYDDYFFGPYSGRARIKEMLTHFYAGGARFKWEFFDHLSDGERGYARYRFSYDSKSKEAPGTRVAFDGMSHVVLAGGLIRRYEEVFDRGMALAQQSYDPVRLVRIGQKYAARLKADPAWARHLGAPDGVKG